jgi:hypothetical protein
MMKSSPFKKTFYFGLSIFLTPIFVALIITLLIFVNRGPKTKPIEVKKEIIFPPENVIEHDTVYVEKPKPKVVPKVVVEPIKIDTVKVIDTSTQTN